MEFRNATEFSRFLSANDLARMDNTFQQLILCINSYGAGCNCQKKQDREKIYKTCQKIYGECGKIVPRFKNAFFASSSDQAIILYDESGRIIGAIYR